MWIHVFELGNETDVPTFEELPRTINSMICCQFKHRADAQDMALDQAAAKPKSHSETSETLRVLPDSIYEMRM